MSTSHTPAEHLRECILHVLAAAKAPLTSAEIYDQIDSAESRQAVAAQINYLKKAGKVASGMNSDGTSLHMLADLPSVLSKSVQKRLDVQLADTLEAEAEIKAEQSAAATPTLDLPDADLHRIVWSQPSGNTTRFLTLTITDDQPRLNTSGAFAIDPAMLRQIADLIDVLQQKEAA